MKNRAIGGALQSASLAVLILALTAGTLHAQDKSDPLTHGMVQMTLVVGTTTQAEVLETFGAPNITTIDGNGDEMWVYDRHATVSSNSGSGFSVGMVVGAGGDGVGGGGGLGFGKNKARASQSSRTMTLIIKFNSQKRVSDFRSRSSSF